MPRIWKWCHGRSSPLLWMLSFIRCLYFHVTTERIFTVKHTSGISRPLFIPHTGSPVRRGWYQPPQTQVSLRVPLGKKKSLYFPIWHRNDRLGIFSSASIVDWAKIGILFHTSGVRTKNEGLQRSHKGGPEAVDERVQFWGAKVSLYTGYPLCILIKVNAKKNSLKHWN